VWLSGASQPPPAKTLSPKASSTESPSSDQRVRSRRSFDCAGVARSRDYGSSRAAHPLGLNGTSVDGYRPSPHRAVHRDPLRHDLTKSGPPSATVLTTRRGPRLVSCRSD
jgi:hypothetical protein